MEIRTLPARQFVYSMIGLSRDDRYVDKERKESFIAVSSDQHGYVLRAEKDADHKIYLTHVEIYAALDKGKAEIKYGYNSIAQQKIRAAFGNQKWDDFKPKDQAIAMWREKMLLLHEVECSQLGKRPPFTEVALKPLLKKYRKQLIADVVDLEEEDGQRGRGDQSVDLKAFYRPSAKTFKRWYDSYYGSEMDIMALLPRHHGPGKKLFVHKPVSIAFAHEWASTYLDRARPTKADVYRLYLSALPRHNNTVAPYLQVDKVSRKKFEAMIANFNEFDVVAARHGEKVAIKKFMAISRSFTVVAPGQRIEMDFWNVDLMSLFVETGIWNALSPDIQAVIPRERIYFGAAIDVATRYIVAFTASLNPDGASAVATIRMIMTDKRYLSSYVDAKTPWVAKIRPRVIYHDNGSEFIAHKTQGVLHRARITATRPAAGEPACRPFIEKMFHTIGRLVSLYFDGRTFHNPVAKGDYDPQKHASLVVDELIKVFIFAICDIYHNRPHAGLGGHTPNNAWVQACLDYDITYPPAQDEMLLIFGLKAKRTITDYGITFMGITYQDPELQRMRYKYGSKEIEIKFDPECVEHIAFKSDEGWLLAKNTVGLDQSVRLEEWVVARKELKSHYATAAEEGLKIMYEAINRLREMGISATMRAGLSPRNPTAADFQKWEAEYFRYWNVKASDDAPTLIQEGPIPYDPLKIGTAIDRKDLFSKDKIAKAKEAVTDKDEGVPGVSNSSSHVAQYKDDY